MTENDAIMCEICREDSREVKAQYALSLSQSNSGSNINFVCRECVMPQVNFMLSLKVGSVDVQAMWIPIEEQRAGVGGGEVSKG